MFIIEQLVPCQVMFSEKETIKTSKFLSFILRHNPAEIGLELDVNGWADVDELIVKSNKHGNQLTREVLEHVVSTNSKKRFAFDATRQKIRASQGHSLDVKLGYQPQVPPEILYHGTGRQYVESILKTGLQKQSRQHVHLSKDIPTAIQVGGRHGKPVVLEIKAGEMSRNNFSFYLSDNEVWLTDTVPPEFIEVIK